MEPFDTSIKFFTQDEVIQGQQEEHVEDMTTLQDFLESSGSDLTLDDTQITNIGKGLLAKVPFSQISGLLNVNKGFSRIDQSLSTIVHTVEEEVPMLPILGANVDTLLFEQADSVMADALEEILRDKVSQLEPRIKLMEINIDDSEVDKNMVGVSMIYRLTNTNIVREFRDTIVTDKGGDIL